MGLFHQNTAKMQGGNFFLHPLVAQGSCEKIDLVLFGVIPAKAGIQGFHGLTN
jgi:hypothetical protein